VGQFSPTRATNRLNPLIEPSQFEYTVIKHTNRCTFAESLMKISLYTLMETTQTQASTHFLQTRHNISEVTGPKVRATSERSGGGSCSQFLSLLHQGTSLHNTLSICLRFVQLQSASPVADWIHYRCSWNFRVISGRVAWNFLLSSLLPIPRTCLPAAAVYQL